MTADDLCYQCGRPFLPAHGINGDCSMFISSRPTTFPGLIERGRREERERIVKWLREMQNPLYAGFIARLAGSIEQGLHLSEGKDG